MGLIGNLKKMKPTKLSKKDVQKLKGGERVPEIKKERFATHEEIKSFEKEVKDAKAGTAKAREKKKGKTLPTRVSGFDKLIKNGGLTRGSTILICGGAGTGKTTFCMESIYNAALNGERAIYLSLEEEPDKLKEHMLDNYGWDFNKLEREGKISILKYDPLKIARSVEASILGAREELEIEFEEFELPFKPDRVIVDSLSALSIAFGSKKNYRRYIRYLFEKLEGYNSINFVLTETEQNPKTYSRAGIEEFLADGVVVLYNIQSSNTRTNAIEILKLRTSKHEKKIVPFEITARGIEIYPNQQVFRED